MPPALAAQAATVCTAGMQGHRWSPSNVAAARVVLDCPAGPAFVRAVAGRLGAGLPVGEGWLVVRLPAGMDDEALTRAGSVVLAVVGWPFNSIDDRGRLWIGRESDPDRPTTSFGGTGGQNLHIDAPNVEHVPPYTALLALRPDPAGGGASLVGDLGAAAAAMSALERAELARPVWFEGLADGLHGVGGPLLPFPVLELDEHDRPVWIRWAAKMLQDDRNAGRTQVLQRFADELALTVSVVLLERGDLLLLDQRRAAHGRAALGDQSTVPPGARRLLVQAKVDRDSAAPASRYLAGQR